ncbi:MAG: glycosyltransferase [Thermoanaerobaculia bacterium]|nr:glycosyltransferase [Thermoanaerobaculia bacterium]
MQRILTVIVHHRGADMLGQCLGSLLASRGHETEIVVVNNGCEEELPAVASSSPRIHEVRANESLGFSEANNLGTRWAEEHLDPFDALYFVNNDTLSHPDALALQAAALEANPQAAIAGPRLVIWGAEDTLNSLGINVTEDAWGWDEGIGIRLADYGPLPPQRSVLAVTGSALLIRADTHRKVGGWTELYDYYFEDIDLCLKARRAGFDVLNVPDAVVQHGISATMTEGSARKDHFFWRNRLLLGFAHWPLALWPTLLGRAVGRDVLLALPQFRALPRRALLQALVRLPSAWRLRCEAPSLSGSRSWTDLLRSAGSVPIISLPEVCYLPIEKRVETTRPSAEVARTESLNPLMGVAGVQWDDSDLEMLVIQGASRPDHSVQFEEWGKRTGNRILVLGWSPLPFEAAQMNYAPGVRAWQLARSLAKQGHQVLLATARMPGAVERSEEGLVHEIREGVLIHHMTWDTFEAPGTLEVLVDAFGPQALVGATPLPARRAVQLAGDLPLWIDLFGDLMAEAQSKAGTASGEHVEAYAALLCELLDRGDRFSAVSERQKWAVVGQLGIQGRLNRETAGEELVHAIPCSAESMSLSSNGEVPSGVVGAGDFVVLWSGGYNTWCDVDTLFEGLDMAMARDSSIRFISTGGIIEGHDEQTYPRFVSMVEASVHRDRFHLLGRRSKSEADAWVRRAKLGVVTEKTLYERALGSSQRLTGWIAAGLPFVCTANSEIGQEIERRGLGFTYAPGSAESLTRVLIEAAKNPEMLAEVTRAGRLWSKTLGSDQALTSPLLQWAEHPRRAGDAAQIDGNGHSVLQGLLHERDILRQELGSVFRQLAGAESQLRRLSPFEEAYHEVRSELGSIHESQMWKLWMTYLEGRRRLLGK